LQLTDQSGFLILEIRIGFVERGELLFQRTKDDVHLLAYFGRLVFIPREHADCRGQRGARMLIRALALLHVAQLSR
jgi:hypothetical protein